MDFSHEEKIFHIQELKDIPNRFNAILKKLNQANIDIKNQNVQLITYTKDISRTQKNKKGKTIDKQIEQICRRKLGEKGNSFKKCDTD